MTVKTMIKEPIEPCIVKARSFSRRELPMSAPMGKTRDDDGGEGKNQREGETKKTKEVLIGFDTISKSPNTILIGDPTPALALYHEHRLLLSALTLRFISHTSR